MHFVYICKCNLKNNNMIEMIVGGFIYWIINTIEKDRKTLKRVREAKKKLFTDDRPKYETFD